MPCQSAPAARGIPRRGLTRHNVAASDGRPSDIMKLFARDALLPSGWAHDVLVDVAGDGSIRAVEVAFAAPADAERVQGPLIPGMPNVHSHAFQRALAGLTERGGPGADNFWTWRTEMYRFLERIGPNEQEAIAAQLYIELLKAGYT